MYCKRRKSGVRFPDRKAKNRLCACQCIAGHVLEEITGQGMPVECSKLTCFAKVNIRHGSRAVRPTIEVGRCQSSSAYCEAEFDLGKGKNRSRATYPH